MDQVSLMAAGFCLASALGLTSFHEQKGSLPPELYAFALIVLFGFIFIMMGNIVHDQTLALFLDRIGTFLSLSAFFIIISTPFPPWMRYLTVLTWSVYFVSSAISAALFAVRLHRAPQEPPLHELP